MNKVTLLKGDCLQKLKELEDNTIDSIVTDPPYGLAFMGKKWDYDVPSQAIWEECMRVLKPGGHLLAFAGSRTYHRMAVRIEDAGFDIRDQIMWVYGSGFPKSHNVGNAIDKKHGAGNRGHAISSGNKYHPTTGEARPNGEKLDKYEARTEEGKGWEGWGTALKPAHEPIVMARKPFKGGVAENVLEWGTGGINIDESRIGNETRTVPVHSDDVKDDTTLFGLHPTIQHERVETTQGRFPANFIHDGIEEEWSRYFYCPKASKKDRDEGITTEAAPLRDTKGGSRDYNARCGNCGKKFIGSPNTICSCENPITDNQVFTRKNFHPTVKPTDLMAYLVRLVTPKGGTVLDPFMGSGSTGKGAIREGMDFIGIEREDEYMEIAKTRIEHEKGKHNYRKFFDI